MATDIILLAIGAAIGSLIGVIIGTHLGQRLPLVDIDLILWQLAAWWRQ